MATAHILFLKDLAVGANGKTAQAGSPGPYYERTLTSVGTATPAVTEATMVQIWSDAQVRFAIGDTATAVTASSPAQPANVPQTFAFPKGKKVAVRSY